MAALASVTEDRTAIYVSSPLTTGSRAFEWHRQHRHSDPGRHAEAFSVDVVEPNRKEAARFAHKLRATTDRLVIDPTAMADVEDWTQADYRDFWGRVIAQYCKQVIFRDGWQFSSGCAYEYLVARETGATVLGQNGDSLDKDEAEQLLADAIIETEAHGSSSDFLRSVRAALQEDRDG
jgi:hypothetical protein